MTIDKLFYIPIEPDKIEGLIELLQNNVRAIESNIANAYTLPSSNSTARAEKEKFIGELKERKLNYQYYLKQAVDASDRKHYKGGRHNYTGDEFE